MQANEKPKKSLQAELKVLKEQLKTQGAELEQLRRESQEQLKTQKAELKQLKIQKADFQEQLKQLKTQKADFQEQLKQLNIHERQLNVLTLVERFGQSATVIFDEASQTHQVSSSTSRSSTLSVSEASSALPYPSTPESPRKNRSVATPILDLRTANNQDVSDLKTTLKQSSVCRDKISQAFKKPKGSEKDCIKPLMYEVLKKTLLHVLETQYSGATFECSESGNCITSEELSLFIYGEDDTGCSYKTGTSTRPDSLVWMCPGKAVGEHPLLELSKRNYYASILTLDAKAMQLLQPHCGFKEGESYKIIDELPTPWLKPLESVHRAAKASLRTPRSLVQARLIPLVLFDGLVFLCCTAAIVPSSSDSPIMNFKTSSVEAYQVFRERREEEVEEEEEEEEESLVWDINEAALRGFVNFCQLAIGNALLFNPAMKSCSLSPPTAVQDSLQTLRNKLSPSGPGLEFPTAAGSFKIQGLESLKRYTNLFRFVLHAKDDNDKDVVLKGLFTHVLDLDDSSSNDSCKSRFEVEKNFHSSSDYEGFSEGVKYVNGPGLDMLVFPSLGVPLKCVCGPPPSKAVVIAFLENMNTFLGRCKASKLVHGDIAVPNHTIRWEAESAENAAGKWVVETIDFESCCKHGGPYNRFNRVAFSSMLLYPEEAAVRNVGLHLYDIEGFFLSLGYLVGSGEFVHNIHDTYEITSKELPDRLESNWTLCSSCIQSIEEQLQDDQDHELCLQLAKTIEDMIAIDAEHLVNIEPVHSQDIFRRDLKIFLTPRSRNQKFPLFASMNKIKSLITNYKKTKEKYVGPPVQGE